MLLTQARVDIASQPGFASNANDPRYMEVSKRMDAKQIRAWTNRQPFRPFALLVDSDKGFEVGQPSDILVADDEVHVVTQQGVQVERIERIHGCVCLEQHLWREHGIYIARGHISSPATMRRTAA